MMKISENGEARAQESLQQHESGVSISFCLYVSLCHCTNELIQLQLQESYCLPILTYAFPGLCVNSSQIRELNVCWNSVYRKIFHYNRWESVKCCINGLGRMDLVHILAFQALKFWKSLMQSTNRTLYSTFMCFRRECDLYDSIANV